MSRQPRLEHAIASAGDCRETDPALVPANVDIAYPSAIPFLLVHVGCVAAIWTGITWTAIGLCAALYWLRMFGVTAGYHRYFSHRAYMASRPFQFALAALAQSTAQRSVLWWAAKHRHHHLHADTTQDVHSPRHTGFLYSHVGWLFARQHAATDLRPVHDLARYAELRWLHRFELAPALLLAAFCFVLAGWPGLVVGFLWSTVLVYHATFCINSLAHVRGSRRYVTGDDSRNNLVLALVTMGEGWHNNHHACPSSVRQGFCWWEIDATWYILGLLGRLGLVRNLRVPPGRLLRNEHRLGPQAVQRTAAQLAGRFDERSIASAIAALLNPVELSALRNSLARPGSLVGTMIGLAAPALPSRTELLVQAKAMFGTTVSLNEIVQLGHELLLATVGRCLMDSASDGR